MHNLVQQRPAILASNNDSDNVLSTKLLNTCGTTNMMNGTHNSMDSLNSTGVAQLVNVPKTADNDADLGPITSLFTTFDVENTTNGVCMEDGSSQSLPPPPVVGATKSMRSTTAVNGVPVGAGVSVESCPFPVTGNAMRVQKGNHSANISSSSFPWHSEDNIMKPLGYRPWQERERSFTTQQSISQSQLSRMHSSYPAFKSTPFFDAFDSKSMMSASRQRAVSTSTNFGRIQHDPYTYNSGRTTPASMSGVLRAQSAATSQSMLYPVVVQTDTEVDSNITVAVMQKVPRQTGAPFRMSPRQLSTVIPTLSPQRFGSISLETPRRTSVTAHMSTTSVNVLPLDRVTLRDDLMRPVSTSNTPLSTTREKWQVPGEESRDLSFPRVRSYSPQSTLTTASSGLEEVHKGFDIKQEEKEEEEKKEEEKEKEGKVELQQEKEKEYQEKISQNDENLRVVVVKGKYQRQNFVTDITTVSVGALVIVEGDRGEDIGTVECIESMEYFKSKNANIEIQLKKKMEVANRSRSSSTSSNKSINSSNNNNNNNNKKSNIPSPNNNYDGHKPGNTGENIPSPVSPNNHNKTNGKKRKNIKESHSPQSPKAQEAEKTLSNPFSLPRVCRLATEDDRTAMASLRSSEEAVLPEVCRIVYRFAPAEKVVVDDVEYQLDRQKITVYVRRESTDVFVNFRRMQRRLHRLLKCRIWLAYMDEVETGRCAEK
ncbi:uncharacterized protein TM35_000083540 [Trypanosoma theileri]|uniref:PSP1 C-terminal domain-containing protein n=1 Tax=Trypanosoma theileri TaxID=67003 RepID=A0A1X0P0U9_9TRYP|nr:uncharacterized protein TM35_000083540 [Trypanosoma theileri]ORC90556.1 hypothetical protein TM35_000083540 [Trypanosoma theileri]